MSEAKRDSLNVHETADLLGAHAETVRRLARTRQIPSFKVWRSWRFSRNAIAAWAGAHHERERVETIAVVDVDERTTFTLNEILKTRGYKVVVENDGKQALQLLIKCNPDALILDLRFPDTDGAQILAEVSARFPMLPVVILAAHPDGELVPRVLEHSPVVLLSKPTRQKQLLEAMDLALGARSRRAAG